jgi:hypothetical protein
VQGVVRDSAGQPVEAAVATLRVYSQDSGVASRFQFPYAVTDSLGGYQLRWDSLDGATIDSVRVTATPPGCQYHDQIRVLGGDQVPEARNAVVDLDAAPVEPPAAARSEPGEFCAYGIHPSFGPGAYRFVIKIDSVSSPLIWGRWRINYRITSGDDEGTLIGAEIAGAVLLNLAVSVPWNGCDGLALSIPVATDGSWQVASVHGQQGCLVDPKPFRFVAETLGYFP